MAKNFLYYLLEEDGRSIHVQNGVVTSSSTPKPLPQTPDKWQEISVSWERDPSKHGIQRTFSTGIDFVRDGAHILREAFYNTNVERRIYLLIQRLTLELDTNFFQWLYKYFYKGEIDLSTCNDSDYTASVNIMEAKLSRMLKAHQDTVFEIDIDNDTEMKSVRMDGIVLTEKGNFSLVTDLPIAKTLYGDNFFLPFTFVNRDGRSFGMDFADQQLEDTSAATWSQKQESDNWCARANEANTAVINLQITGTVKYTCNQNDVPNGFRARFIRSQQDIGNQNDYQIFTGTPVAGNKYEFDIDITIPLQPGERLYFEGIYFGGGGVDIEIEFDEGADLALNFTSRYKTTYIKGLTAFTLYKRLIEKITGTDTYAQSELVQAYENIIITSGDAIRGLTGKIKTSLNKFFQSMDAVLCAGMAIENDKIVLEEREHFYDDSTPVSLGNVKDCKRSYAKEVMANTFKVGYPENKIDDVNGKYEFNNAHLYTSPITQIVKEYSILSDYKTSPYLIESLRWNLDGKTTTDNETDNDVFMLNTEADQATSVADANVSFLEASNLMICSPSLQFVIGQTIEITGSISNNRVYKVIGIVNVLLLQFVALETIPAGGSLVDETDVVVTITWLSGVVQKLKRVTYDSIEGIPTESIDSIFNIELFTPKRMLLRHGKWIRAMLHGFDMNSLVFQTTEKNPGLKTTLGTEVIDEDADQPIDELDAPLFIPKYFEFETEVPTDLVDLFEANANRCFEFVYNGVTYKGFNIKSALMPNTLQPQSFKVLSVADNDFSELVF